MVSLTCRARQSTKDTSGRGAAWLARLLGVQEVAGSNPVAPTSLTVNQIFNCTSLFQTLEFQLLLVQIYFLSVPFAV